MSNFRTTVGLDGFFLSELNTGSGQYTFHLWRQLCVSDDSPRAVLLTPEGLNGSSAPDCVYQIPVPQWLRAGKAKKLWWEQSGNIRAARSAGADLLHVPYFSAPRFSSIPTIITIHDVIPLLFPEYGGSRQMRGYLRLVSNAARRADAIITDSECSRRDIVRLLHIPEELIHVIPLAVDESYGPSTSPEVELGLRERYGLPGPVIFNVGGLDVRKNLAVLIEAFAHALPELDPATRLVIAGRAHTGNDALYPPLEPVIERYGLEQHVVLTGAISENDKRALYNLADLYVYPSLYEGFGLSPLEAMACGTPVVSSSLSSLPEVVGTGGIQLEPTPGRLAAAIISVMNDEYLRRDLVHRSLAQASTFSWQRTAAMTREVYQEVLQGRVLVDQRSGTVA